ncbi:MAG TPA: 7-carboxy-7-deazaguanine synthase QueE [Candidatus Omnitrophota bacterium]|nr:7-carboxy-7-deazaguanine synthase QueE [Candidatus Omnitrophota bacterium]
MTGKISEIFKSTQGEGPYMGTKQLFIRFYGCNTNCSFCDTKLKDFREYRVDSLESEISNYRDFHSISLTGGEPLCQTDFICEFLKRVDELHHLIYLETNGTLPAELNKIIGLVDIISMDFKLPSSTGREPFWKEHEEFLNIAIQKEAFVKMVITKMTTQEDVFKAAEIIKKVKSNIQVVLQPNWFDMNQDLLSRIVVFKKYFLDNGMQNLKILPQAHKYAGIK